MKLNANIRRGTAHHTVGVGGCQHNLNSTLPGRIGYLHRALAADFQYYPLTKPRTCPQTSKFPEWSLIYQQYFLHIKNRHIHPWKWHYFQAYKWGGFPKSVVTLFLTSNLTPMAKPSVTPEAVKYLEGSNSVIVNSSHLILCQCISSLVINFKTSVEFEHV